MVVYLQLGTIIGAILGWIDGQPGRRNLRAAITALGSGATLLFLGSVNLTHQQVALTSLGGIALGYGLAFLVRRLRGDQA